MKNEPSVSSVHPELWALLVEEMIDEASAQEVEAARKIMESYFAGQPRLERKQMSNLVAVAGETVTVPIVEDFVRYQMGRDTGCQTWNAGSPKSLGKSILDHLKELKTRATALVERARKRSPDKLPAGADESEINRVWCMLCRRFVAYLEHSFLYYKSEKGQRGGER
jgi:hypothetical protein